MNREILFRGKRIDNGEWVEGFYVKHGSRHWIYTGEIQYMYLPVCADLPTKYEVDPESICQYTGYTDLRKKKAFEHDIIFYEDGQCHGHIVFKEGCFLIEWEEEKPDLRRDIHFWFTERRAYVVGNVFDNPELLNQ